MVFPREAKPPFTDSGNAATMNCPMKPELFIQN
jgi:hypothetical protein